MKRFVLMLSLMFSMQGLASAPAGSQVGVQFRTAGNLVSGIGDAQQAAKAAAETWAKEGNASTYFEWVGGTLSGDNCDLGYKQNVIDTEFASGPEVIDFHVCSNGYWVMYVHADAFTNWGEPAVDGGAADLESVIQRGFGKYLGASSSTVGCINGPTSGLTISNLQNMRGVLCDDEITSAKGNGSGGTLWNSYGTIQVYVSDAGSWPQPLASGGYWDNIYPEYSEWGFGGFDIQRGYAATTHWRDTSFFVRVDAGTSSLTDYEKEPDGNNSNAINAGPSTTTVHRPTVVYDPTRQMWWFFVVEKGTGKVAVYKTSDRITYTSMGYLTSNAEFLQWDAYTVITHHPLGGAYDPVNDLIVLTVVDDSYNFATADAGNQNGYPWNGIYPPTLQGYNNWHYTVFKPTVPQMDVNHQCTYYPFEGDGIYPDVFGVNDVFESGPISVTSTTPAVYCSDVYSNDLQEVDGGLYPDQYAVPCEVVYTDLSTNHLMAWKTAFARPALDSNGYVDGGWLSCMQYGPVTTCLPDAGSWPWSNCGYGTPIVDLGVPTHVSPSVVGEGWDAGLGFGTPSAIATADYSDDSIYLVVKQSPYNINGTWSAPGQIQAPCPQCTGTTTGPIGSTTPPVIAIDPAQGNYNIGVGQVDCTPNGGSNISICDWQ